MHLDYEQMRINHSGGFLPILVGIATEIGALAEGEAAIANAVTDTKHQRAEEEEEETKRQYRNGKNLKKHKYWVRFEEKKKKLNH